MLTAAQLQTLKTNINAETDAGFVAMRTANNEQGMADWYNADASPTAKAWDRATPVDRIHDAIDYDKFTPVDAADGTAIQTNRLLIVQTKQMNLQGFMIGRTTFDGTKAKGRAGLRDALINLPAGVNGANVVAAGASAVNAMNACLRPENVSRGEKLFSSGTATTGGVTGELLVFEGDISAQDISDALRA